jgi:hypothetical protein
VDKCVCVRLVRRVSPRIRSGFAMQVHGGGSAKIKTMMPSPFMKEIQAGDLQNLSLIRILDYTCNKIKDHM